MWILIVVTMLISGNHYGANPVQELRFNYKKECLEVAEKLNTMVASGISKEPIHPIKAFCIFKN